MVEGRRRYWGLAIFSIVWSIVQMALSAGSPLGAGAFMWAFVAYHAVRGNARALRQTAEIVLWIQIIVGAILLAMISGDQGSRMFSGDPFLGVPVIFLISIAIPTALWFFVFWRAGVLVAQKDYAPTATTNQSSIASHAHKLREIDPSTSVSVAEHSTEFAETIVPNTIGKKAEDQRQEAREAVTAVDPEMTDEPGLSLEDFPTAKSRINFGNGADQAWSKIKDLPLDLQRRFLAVLNDKEYVDWDQLAAEIDKLTAEIIAEHEKSRLSLLLGEFPQAAIAIEYRPDVAAAWSELSTFPANYQTNFLEALDVDPKQDPAPIIESIRELYHKDLNPFDEEEANVAFTQLKAVSPPAALEFQRAYKLLGDTVSAKDLAANILEKLGIDGQLSVPDENN